MMNRLTSIFLLIYYTFGSLILPEGNFSFLSELPKMYAHCKAFEDKDMNIVDFITDHLLNIDGIFDAHDNDDDQKPHSPQPLQNLVHATFFCIVPPPLLIIHEETTNILPHSKTSIFPPYSGFCQSAYVSFLFRPPIV
jgi:hypothetical protein